MGVWIEIKQTALSLTFAIVTPCVGVWIEIFSPVRRYVAERVTPCVGVWIEILVLIIVIASLLSLPVWECGLKSRTVRQI